MPRQNTLQTEKKYRTGSKKQIQQEEQKKLNQNTVETYKQISKVLRERKTAKRKKLLMKFGIGDQRAVDKFLYKYHNKLSTHFKVQDILNKIIFFVVPVCTLFCLVFCYTDIQSKKTLYATSKTEFNFGEYDTKGIFSNTIELPKKINGINIEWSTSNSDVLNTDTGEIVHQATDTPIVITAKYSTATASIIKNYNTVVYRDPNYQSDERISYTQGDETYKKETNKIDVSEDNLTIDTSNAIKEMTFDISYAQPSILTQQNAIDFVRELNLDVNKKTGEAYKIPEELKVTRASYNSNDNLYQYKVEGEIFIETLNDSSISENTSQDIKDVTNKEDIEIEKDGIKPGKTFEVTYDLYCNTDRMPVKVVITKNIKENTFTYKG